MIKAASKTAFGEPVLFLGLSGENVTRLAAGEPIMIGSGQLAALGLPPMVIAIHYGRRDRGQQSCTRCNQRGTTGNHGKPGLALASWTRHPPLTLSLTA
jgi:hypothetical protein